MTSPSISKPGDWNIPLVIILTSVFAAILFGLVSVTANPILVIFSAAILVGAGLMVRPAWIVWLVLSLGLLVQGNLPLYIPDSIATKAAWGVSMLGFFLMLLAILRVITVPSTRESTPVFIWVALGFLAYALLNSLIQWNSAVEYFGGFKRYFQMWGLIFALAWLAFDEQNIHRWQIFVVITALIQLPFVIQQVVVFVPIREGLSHFVPGLIPIDVVAGTFEANLYQGGSNGEMAAFLIIIAVFLLTRLQENQITLPRFLLLLPVILAPLFLGETKAVVVMIPLVLLVLYRRELITRPLYGLVILLVGIIFIVSLAYAYLSMTRHGSLDDLIDETIGYNVQGSGYADFHLNRTTVITFWAERQGAHDPVSFVFGNGLGSGHTETGGHVAMRYPRHGISLTAASSLLWEMGVFGFGLFASILILAWRCAGRLRKESAIPMVRADAKALQAILVLLGFFLFYRASMLETLSIQIVFAMQLGYLAWLHRQHVSTITDNSVHE